MWFFVLSTKLIFCTLCSLSLEQHRSLIGNEDGTFPTQKAIGQGEGSIELSEERRLCYVAMTRAKTHLVLTWRREVSYFAGNSFRTKDADRSRFLNVLVSKPDDKTKGSTSNTPIANKSPVTQKSSVGTRRIHTDATLRRQTSLLQSQTGRSNKDNREPTKQRPISDSRARLNLRPGTRMVHSDATTGVSSRNWDNWEPSQQRKTIQQVPSIRPISSQSGESRQRSVRSVSSETTSMHTRNTSTANNTQPSRSNEADRPQRRQQQEPQYHRGSRSDPPPDIDSTLFYPVGSSVKHKFYGKGFVEPPPKSDLEFAEKLLVRVKFADKDGHWDLPMDSLEHTFE